MIYHPQMIVRRALVALALATPACAAGPEDPPERALPTELAALEVPTVIGHTEALATVAGPTRELSLPFYGTDLGWAFEHESELWVMFGDTWSTFLATSIQPEADDALAKISLVEFPDGDAVERWIADHRAPPGAPPWHARGPELDVLREPGGAPSAMRPLREGVKLTSGPALTPVAGFSNARQGEASGAFGLFLRYEPVQCREDGSCDDGFDCDDQLGQCSPVTDLSRPCVLGTTDCWCVRVGTGRGLCQDRTSSVYDASSDTGRTHAVVMRQPVGVALHGEEATFAARSWDTNRFYNATARTVNDFDAHRPAGRGNDYTRATGARPERDGVFVWGRPGFGGVGSLGRDAQLYLAWVPMPEYDPTGNFAWTPRYFAGLDDAGAPRFVEREVDAMPLDLDASAPGHQPEEIHDVVGQMSISWVPALRRFVMFYGGGIGTELAKVLFGSDYPVLEQDPLGGLYVRYAEHPWGPWTPPEPLIHAGAPELGITGQYGPGGLLHHGSCTLQSCAPPELAFFGQEREWGRLYAPAIIEPWTEERPGAVDLYWHMSTWNPYQVVLMKTRLPTP